MPLKTRLSIIIFIVASALYANTLFNGYVRDDFDLIVNNSQVNKGTRAIGTLLSSKLRDGSGTVKNELYRPITKLIYAFEWQLSKNNPLIGHLVNVLLFSLLCVLVFLVCIQLLKQNLVLSFAAALFFTVHPIHTEVVANIKSVDEILALMFFLFSLLSLYKYLQFGHKNHVIASVAFYALSLFSKESAITFFPILLVVLFYAGKRKISDTVKIFSLYLLPLLLFLTVRHQVMADYDHSKMIARIDNFLIIAGSPAQKLGSCIYMLGVYVKLLFIPYPLVCDYSFNHFPLVTFTNPWVILVSILIIGSAFYALKTLKNKNIYAFCIIWLFITMSIASNIFFMIGTNFAERLLFAPSFGFCILLSCLLFPKKENVPDNFLPFKPFGATNKVSISVCCITIIIFAIITIGRNAEWKNDFTLVSADIKKNQSSARLHLYMATELRNQIVISKSDKMVQKKNLPLIKEHLDKAISIYPEYGTAHFAMGEYLMHIDSMRPALNELKYSLYFLSRSPKVYNAISLCLLGLHRYDSVLYYVNAGLQLQANNPDLMARHGSFLLIQHKPDSAILLLKQSLAIFPENGKVLEELSKAYAIKNDSLHSNYYKQLSKQYLF